MPDGKGGRRPFGPGVGGEAAEVIVLHKFFSWLAINSCLASSISGFFLDFGERQRYFGWRLNKPTGYRNAERD